MANRYSTLYQAGYKFGLMTVLCRSNRKRHYLCRCICGNEREVRTDHIADGAVMSCGCNAAEKARARMTIHGHNPGGGETPTYSSWLSMRRRCLTSTTKGFQYWGGNGVTICKQWDDFANFLADMGERPKGTTLDRFPDNKGNYEPGNCRWATKTEQAENKTTTIILEYCGKKLSLKEWALESGITRKTLFSRVKKGWEIGRILDPRHGHITAKRWAQKK